MKMIDKDSLENILRGLWKEDDGKNPEHRICYNKALQDVQREIDSLEVKDVDLDKEIEEHVLGMPMSEFTHDSEVEGFWDWAREEFRHFFGLGVKVQKGE